jgi:histidyl-tRNA synthetase
VPDLSSTPQSYRALRGTHDILPEESTRWQRLEDGARRLCSRYGFREIRTPVLESCELFARSVGTSSDIVTKQLYTFAAGEETVCLRPENTAPVVRAFIEHALYRQVATGYPERLFYIGPMFRHERPQKGRQRQFHQIGVEVLGADQPLADAETIEMASALLVALGIEGQELALNSVGDAACRPRFREELLDWLRERVGQLCEDCQRRYLQNPLRVFDCKVEADRRILMDAPSLLDRLCEPCTEHFGEVRAMLDAYGAPYRIEPRLVRGLDYYERTVFEFEHQGLGAQNAILGGGRYNGLVQELGGPPLSGLGFAAGMERLLLLMPAGDASAGATELALVVLGASSLTPAALLARRLRAAGIGTLMPMTDRPLGAQLRRADRAGVRFALLVGGQELARGRYALKDLRTGEQVELEEGDIEDHVRRAQ